MKTIHKYPLNLDTEQTLTMPAAAEILSVQDQGGVLCIWALVDTDRLPEERRFRVYGTGHAIANFPHKYLATVIQGSFVWHVFERFTASRGVFRTALAVE